MNTCRTYQGIRGRRVFHDHEQSDYRHKKIFHCFPPSPHLVDAGHSTQRAIRAYAKNDRCHRRNLAIRTPLPLGYRASDAADMHSVRETDPSNRRRLACLLERDERPYLSGHTWVARQLHTGIALAPVSDASLVLLARPPAGIVYNEHTEDDGAVVFPARV
jgi:hypothetical protein